jgi:aspartate kinase
MAPPTERCDRSDQREQDESAEPTEANDPAENSEHALPTDPIERNEPTDPIESTEPFDAIESTECSERIDQRDVGMGRVLAHPGGGCAGDAARYTAAMAEAAAQPASGRVLVMKFGGTSVADAEKIRRVAARLVAAQVAGRRVVGVVSAMGQTTDQLVELARGVSPRPHPREMDMLLSTGERITAALCAMAINDLGAHAVSLTGSQAGIVTDTVHTKAKILEIRPRRISEALDRGEIVLVAGFQGVSTAYDVTTLGRGGSDTTAVALAAALGGDCEIYTDVAGVFTADPRIVPHARKLRTVSPLEMLEMAGSGARVLQLRSVEFARNHGVPLHVRSTFTDADGTWIREDTGMEAPIISGITHTTDEAYVTLTDVPDKPGTAASIFNAVAGAHINVDTIIQNAVTHGDADVTFSVPLDDLPLMTNTIEGLCHDLGLHWRVDDTAAKVSLIGAGMKSHPGVAAKMFQVLADLGINVRMIATSPIKVSCVVSRDRVAEAVSALHGAFEVELAEADGTEADA